VVLYDSLGGAAGLEALVDRLYARVLADPLLSPWFESIDLPKLKGHQHAFLAVALGGPHAYAGRSLGHAHAAIDLTHEAFDAMLGHLAGTLAEFGADEHAVEAVLTKLAPLERDIVSSQSVA
jgi:hemoglobin